MSNGRGSAFWERLVREVEAGGHARDVAQRHGVSASGLLFWRRKLRTEGTRSGGLLPVRVLGESRRRMDVSVGAHRLSFEEGSEPSYVAALVQALSR